MELVPASRFTLQQLTDAYNQTRVDYLIPMPMTPPRLQEYIDSYDVDLDASAVAVEAGGHILGLCMLGLREELGWITRLGVLPTTRRHGTGMALTNACIEQAVQRGVQMLYLEVIIGNTPAHTLFLRLGFREVRKLLVLRRPPGPPPPEPIPPPAHITWHTPEETLSFAANCPWRPAWTHQVESLANAGGVQSAHLVELGSKSAGWVSFQRSPLQLRKVMVVPDEGTEAAPAYNLLYHLHRQFASLDTIAENVPTHVSYLDAYWALGYIQSFARIEMELPLVTA